MDMTEKKERSGSFPLTRLNDFDWKLEDAARKIQDRTIVLESERIRKVVVALYRGQEFRGRKDPSLQKLVSYYLPTAVQLLKRYGQLEAEWSGKGEIHEIQNTVSQALKEIAEGTEAIHKALLASLTLETAVESTVLKQNLQMDGLQESLPSIKK